MNADHRYRPDPHSREWFRRDCFDYAPLNTAAPTARARTCRILAEWQLSALAEEAESVVGELVANAIKACAEDDREWPSVPPAIRVWTLASSERTAILVWDGFRGVPRPRALPVSIEDEGGRGLLMVGELATNWGFFTTPVPDGKVTWAIFGSRAPAPAPPRRAAYV